MFTHITVQKIGRWASLLSLAMPLISFGDGAGTVVHVQPLPDTGITTIRGLLDKVCQVGSAMFAALLVLAIIFIIIAAFKYMTAGGDSEKVTEANHQILYAAIAVAIGVFAKVVPIIVGSFFTSSTITAC